MAVRHAEFLSLFFHSVFRIWRRALFPGECTALTLWHKEPPFPWHPPSSAGDSTHWCSGQAGAVPKPAGFAPIPFCLPPTSWAPPPLPAPSLVRAVTHAHSPHFTSDAVRQVRQTFCLIHLIHSALLRMACRVCSNAEFKTHTKRWEASSEEQGSWISNNVLPCPELKKFHLSMAWRTALCLSHLVSRFLHGLEKSSVFIPHWKRALCLSHIVPRFLAKAAMIYIFGVFSSGLTAQSFAPVFLSTSLQWPCRDCFYFLTTLFFSLNLIFLSVLLFM